MKTTFIIYRPGARGIRQNITLSDDISRGACPEGNIIAEGNILPNPPSGGSINDILYRKICHRKNSTTMDIVVELFNQNCILVRLCTSPTVSENVFRAFFVAFVVFFECRSSNIRWISSSLSGSVLSAIAAILT